MCLCCPYHEDAHTSKSARLAARYSRNRWTQGFAFLSLASVVIHRNQGPMNTRTISVRYAARIGITRPAITRIKYYCQSTLHATIAMSANLRTVHFRAWFPEKCPIIGTHHCVCNSASLAFKPAAWLRSTAPQRLWWHWLIAVIG